MKTTCVSAWFFLAAWSQAEDRSVTLSRFNFPLDTGKLLYAYPAVTVESSVWGENFSGAPSLRGMPTAVSVQSSVWSSSFTPPPQPRTETTAPPRESETSEAKRKKRKIHAPAEEAEKAHPAPPPAEETEKAHPKPAPPAEAEKAHPKPAPPEEAGKAHPKRHVETAEQKKPRFRSQQHLREPEESERREVVEREVVPAAEAPLIQVSGSAGYYSRYMFRGLDVAYRTGIDGNNESPFVGTNAAVSIGNFAVGAWYIESLNSYAPGGAGFDKSFGGPAKETDFRTPQRVRYQEYDLFANYTFRLTHDLALTTGMNFYWFEDGRFWAQGDKHIGSTKEAAASLNWTGIPYLNQSLNYYYDFDAFKGAYLEYKVATRPFELYRNGDFAIGLSPNLSVSYDFRYNGTNNGWNNIEPGIDLPVHISDGLSLNVGVKYSWDLGDRSVGAHGAPAVRTDDRLWFSATFQYAFPIGEKSKVLASRDGNSLISGVAAGPADPGPWRIAAGAGVRNIHSSFQVGPAAPFDINSRFKRLTGGGDVDLATAARDGVYLDGSVYSATGPVWFLTPPPVAAGNLYGTSNFSYANQSQFVSQGSGINRQVTYHSDRFSYDTSDSRNGFSASDDEAVVYPYISLTRELAKWSWGEASVGLGYSYNHSSSESGFRLTGLQIATQNSKNYFFTYDIDNLYGPLNGPNAPFDNHYNIDPTAYQAVVYDGYLYSNSIATTAALGAFGAISPAVPFAGPQKNIVGTTQELARVGIFRGSKLDTDLHAISVPFDVTFNLTRRIKAHLSTGPTFNIFDVEQQTDTYYQLLDPLVSTQGTATVQSHRSPYDANTNAVINANTLGGAVTGGAASNVGAGNSQLTSGTSPSQSASGGGGKGSSAGKSRGLPGSTLAHTVNRGSAQEFKCGVFGELSLEVDLDAAKRWFVEVYARYDYVPSFTISEGGSTATIDASSWGSGIGLGFRF